MQSVHGPLLVFIMFFRYFPTVFITIMTRAKLSSMAGVIVLCCCMNVFPAIAADNPKVLVLHSYHSGFQWTDDQNSAIIKSLQSAYPEGDVFVEYMNTKRVALEVMSPMLRQNYAALYRNAGLNVIITTDNNALDFLLKYGEELFPGVPVVFCGINNFDDYNLGNRRNYTGVREDFDVGATLDTALRFHPDTHTVAIIADVTESSQITLAIARDVAKKYGKIRFVELSGLSETVLAEKLDNLERGTIILLLSYYRTPEGRVFSVKEGMQLIQKHTQLPLYALWDFYMLPPAIGGKIVTGRLQGEAAAEIAIRVLKGEKPAAIPPYSSPTSYYFNYDALQKFNIPAALIPADSIIAGKPDTIYSRFKTYIRIGAGFALGLIATILILLHGIVLQRRMKEDLAAREREFRTLAENSPNIIIRYDRECRRTYVNPAFIRETGKSYEQLIGVYPESSWLPTMPVEEYRVTLQQVMGTGIPAKIVVEWPRLDDGRILCHAFHLVAERGSDGQATGCLAIGHNITALKEAKAALIAKQEHLAAMAVELSLAEERERRRIAAELHDHIGQTLLLSRIKLGTLADVFESGSDEKTYEEIQTLLEQSIRDVRSLTQQLNPPVLASLGLDAALEWLAKRMEADYFLLVDFVDDRSAKPLTEELSSVVYQSARELLINVAKHAGTSEARLAIGREADMLLLTVKDQGCGFECIPEPGTNMPLDYSFGLFNIQQRIKLLGGTVVIESAPGRGTCATIRVPLKDVGKSI